MQGQNHDAFRKSVKRLGLFRLLTMLPRNAFLINLSIFLSLPLERLVPGYILETAKYKAFVNSPKKAAKTSLMEYIQAVADL